MCGHDFEQLRVFGLVIFGLQVTKHSQNCVVCQAADEERYDLVREGVVIFMGALAKHLSLVRHCFESS